MIIILIFINDISIYPILGIIPSSNQVLVVSLILSWAKNFNYICWWIYRRVVRTSLFPGCLILLLIRGKLFVPLFSFFFLYWCLLFLFHSRRSYIRYYRFLTMWQLKLDCLVDSLFSNLSSWYLLWSISHRIRQRVKSLREIFVGLSASKFINSFYTEGWIR